MNAEMYTEYVIAKGAKSEGHWRMFCCLSRLLHLLVAANSKGHYVVGVVAMGRPK